MIMTKMALATAIAAAPPVTSPIEAPGPLAPLAGTYLDAGKGSPVVLIIPGSGPTDRDGNSPLGITAAPYRMLAEELAAKGVSSARIDKRGMFGSKGAIADANKATIAAYAEDARSWTDTIRKRSGAKCVWLLGHSEGGLVALAAAQKREGICGVVSVSAAGRPIGTVMREQLRANPANAPVLDAALGAIDQIEAGKTVDSAALPAPIRPLFAEQVQPYLIDLFSHDPAKLSASLPVPLLILQGDRDLQTGAADATALAAANSRAKLVMLAGVNHVLKIPSGEDRTSNVATYSDSSMPVAPSVVEAVADFVKR